jgi:hypothetical protein
MKLRRKISQRTHLIHSIGHKTHVFGRSGPFRYCTKVDVRLDELAPLSRKFTKRSCVGIFHFERTRSTLLYPKLTFWGILNFFVTARNSMQNFSQRTHLIQSISPKTHVLVRFELFRYFTKLDAKLVELAPLTHKFAKRSCV